MKNYLNLKTNLFVILMTIFYFFILMIIFLFVLFEVKLLGIFLMFFVYYSILFITFRYIVLIRNLLSILLQNNNKKDKKFIFYGNIFSILFYLYAVITGLNLLPGLNLLLIYFEIFITQIFNIPTLYLILNRTESIKYLKNIINVILILISIFNICLIFNGEYIYKVILLP